MRTHRLTRFILIGLISCGLLLGAGLTALANHGKDGDPISEVPNLFADGGPYGTLTDHTDSTEANGESHPEGRCCFGIGDGGSVYKFSAKIGTKIQIDVTDDIAGAGLAQVEILRQHLGEDELPALYGYPDVHDYLVAESSCPDQNSVCRMKWVMPEDDTYYLAFWPQISSTSYATFEFSISIRKPTKTKLSISGASKPVGSKCYALNRGGSVDANVRVTEKATGKVKYRLEKKQKGKWKLIATKDADLVESKASEKQSFKSSGQHRLRALYLGDDTRASSKSKKVCFQVG